MPLGMHADYVQCTQVPIALKHVHLRPAVARSSAALLHLCLQLQPAPSTVTISVRFRKAFMAVWEHMGDAHRGIDIAPGLLIKGAAVGSPALWRALNGCQRLSSMQTLLSEAYTIKAVMNSPVCLAGLVLRAAVCTLKLPVMQPAI